jgi:UDP-glucuronate 4-epimerase
MKILITGVAGFIGYSLALNLLKKKYFVVGIDNLNNYYDKKLKINRLNLLKKYKNFIFKKIDITNSRQLKAISKITFSYIYHFAAQAGVRYSLSNPDVYYKTNVVGFQKLFENINYKFIKKIFYASSSSVYGDQKKFPITEDVNLNAKNPYGVSKKINENLADILSYKLKVPFIGLRFFTVYGEWGRPDMFIIKLSKSLRDKNIFFLNNSGDHYRDFTYINDVVKICCKLKDIKLENKNVIFNICAGYQVNILSLANKIKKYFPGNLALIKRVGADKADVYKTHGDNKKIKRILKNYNFKKIDKGLKKTMNWFIEHYNY